MKKILIVDDCAITRLILVDYFKKNYEVLEASNGKEAYDSYVNNKPDFIFMDIEMPIMNGFEAVEKIGESKKNLPIVALTAYDQGYSMEYFKEQGFTTCVGKPFSKSKLETIVKKYIKK